MKSTGRVENLGKELENYTFLWDQLQQMCKPGREYVCLEAIWEAEEMLAGGWGCECRREKIEKGVVLR